MHKCLLKQRLYARDNVESELIPMSFMTRKDSWRFTTKGEADFIIGCGGVEESIYYNTTLQFLYPQGKKTFFKVFKKKLVKSV